MLCRNCMCCQHCMSQQNGCTVKAHTSNSGSTVSQQPQILTSSSTSQLANKLLDTLSQPLFQLQHNKEHLAHEEKGFELSIGWLSSPAPTPVFNKAIFATMDEDANLCMAVECSVSGILPKAACSCGPSLSPQALSSNVPQIQTPLSSVAAKCTPALKMTWQMSDA
jgi:hypothetical protein